MILIGLGSSLPFSGNAPADIITGALRALAKIARIETVSQLYRSPAWPDPADPPFLNAVVRVETGLAPEPLLAALHGLEAGFGRRRRVRNGPRTLDLDLLDYEGLTRGPEAGSSLSLPHPAIRQRDFVLLPLAEVAPEWRHPVTGEGVSELIAALPVVSAWPVRPYG